MFGWLRRRAAPRPIPDALWQAVLAQFPFLARRDPRDVAALRELAARFLADKEFTGARGFAITDDVAVAIAAQAVLPVLHLGLAWYDDFVGIVVHADEVVAKRTAMDEAGVVHDWEEVISGEAMDRGPVMLSWHDVAGARESAHEGYNVVIHEFVHKIDMRDGRADGCPPLPSARARRAWMEVMQREYEAFREEAIVAERFGGAPTWLDPYGATSIDEFFAVASEAYFVAPQRFREEHGALAQLFDGFFLSASGS
jgi:Mlc titration factor MtfA (ptsG expression regulator)